MTWTILCDHLDPNTPESSKGHSEEHTRIPAPMAAVGFRSEPLPSLGFDLAPLPKIPFRLYDDDGELYYQGLLHDDDECENQSAALAWGAGAGCTTIKVQRETEENGLRITRWTQEIG